MYVGIISVESYKKCCTGYLERHQKGYCGYTYSEVDGFGPVIYSTASIKNGPMLPPYDGYQIDITGYVKRTLKMNEDPGQIYREMCRYIDKTLGSHIHSSSSNNQQQN